MNCGRLSRRARGFACFRRGLTDPSIHPVHREIIAPVVYLPEYLHEAPRRVLRAWRAVRNRPGYHLARTVWLKDLRRDPGRNLSLIHISEPTRLRRISYAVFCL